MKTAGDRMIRKVPSIIAMDVKADSTGVMVAPLTTQTLKTPIF